MDALNWFAAQGGFIWIDGTFVTVNAIGLFSRSAVARWLVILVTLSFGLSIAIERLHMPPIVIAGVPMPFQPLALAALDFSLLIGYRFVCHDVRSAAWSRIWLTLVQVAALMLHVFDVSVYGARAVHLIDLPTYRGYSWLYYALLEILFWANVCVNGRLSILGGFDVVGMLPWLHRDLRHSRVGGGH